MSIVLACTTYTNCLAGPSSLEVYLSARSIPVSCSINVDIGVGCGMQTEAEKQQGIFRVAVQIFYGMQTTASGDLDPITTTHFHHSHKQHTL
jgi:hypothetical protein